MGLFDIFKSNERKINEYFEMFVKDESNDVVFLNNQIYSKSNKELLADKTDALLREVKFNNYKQQLVEDIKRNQKIDNLKEELIKQSNTLNSKELIYLSDAIKDSKTIIEYETSYSTSLDYVKTYRERIGAYTQKLEQQDEQVKKFNMFVDEKQKITNDIVKDFEVDIDKIDKELEQLENKSEYIIFMLQLKAYIDKGYLLPVMKEYPKFSDYWSSIYETTTFENFNHTLIEEKETDEYRFDQSKEMHRLVKEYREDMIYKLRDLDRRCRVNDRLYKFFEEELTRLVKSFRQINESYSTRVSLVDDIIAGYKTLLLEYDQSYLKYQNLVQPLAKVLKDFDFSKEALVEDVSEYYLYSVAKNIEKKRNIYGYSKGIESREVKAAIREISDKLYELTEDQRNAIEKSVELLNSKNTASCLIQGDVSCGKTIVIVTLMFLLAQKGIKSCFIAPRKILRLQHLKSLQKYNELFGLGLKIVDSEEVNDLRDADIIISGYSFRHKKFDDIDIGLGVIDEIQLFGVAQREQIQQKYPHIDMLYTTATPHPRTKLISLIGNMDIIEIRQMPIGRRERTTKTFKKIQNEHVQLIKNEVTKGNTVLSVSPLVNKAGKGDFECVKIAYESFKKLFPTYNVELLLATMSQEKKDEILMRAQNDEIDILVATKSIEVGVDIPNATAIFIHYPHSMSVKWGMSQLHQLRGRVGRNDKPSYCFIESPTKVEPSSPIGSVVRTNDVFKLTQDDFDWRGFAKIIGTSQSGGSCTPKEQKQKIMAYKAIAEKTPEIISNLTEQQIIDTERMLNVFYVSNLN